MNFTNQNFNDEKIDYSISYNVVISTNDYISSNSNFNSLNYGIDWTFLPDQPYNVHFTYLGGINNLDGTEIANLFIDFGSVGYTYQAGNKINKLTTNFLGVLKPYVLGATSFLLAEDNTNPPIYIGSRPVNNIFTVNILDNQNTLFIPTTGSLAEYKLVLKFIPIKN